MVFLFHLPHGLINTLVAIQSAETGAGARGPAANYLAGMYKVLITMMSTAISGAVKVDVRVWLISKQVRLL